MALGDRFGVQHGSPWARVMVLTRGQLCRRPRGGHQTEPAYPALSEVIAHYPYKLPLLSVLLCAALAAVAQAMKAGEDLARTAVTEGVPAALAAGGIPRSAARLAGRAATDMLMKLTPVRHWEDVRRAVQLLVPRPAPFARFRGRP
jgi:hypothetical protein